MHQPLRHKNPPATHLSAAHALHLPLRSRSVDVVITSPPYWQKRDYGFEKQIGREPTASEYIEVMLTVLREMRRVLTDTGSVFLNIGDSYENGSLVGIPPRLENAAREDGWLVPNRIVWAKPSGMPSPSRSRLVNRHEALLHLAKAPDYYYDLQGYHEQLGEKAKSGDVWTICLRPNSTQHLAPFPPELVTRAIHLACPTRVCTRCGQPRRRVTERTAQLDPNRPQARRAMEIARANGLSAEHIRAIQATGISDAGKALHWQTGAGRNSEHVQQLAAEAKQILGGYFREFTFAKRRTVGFDGCRCKAALRPGIVLDTFAGTGTSLAVAKSLGRTAIGFDYRPYPLDQRTPAACDLAFPAAERAA